MDIKFVNTIIFVRDIQKSKQFYSQVFGLNIIEDHGTIVIFDNHFVIHNAASLINTIYKRPHIFSRFKQGHKNLVLYFECDQLEAIYEQIKKEKVKIIHDIEEQTWGQKVFRFYDFDRHIVEIGEPFRIKDFGNRNTEITSKNRWR
jgi:predicted enzyme related to lactoylglutathione lyase